MDAKLDIDQVLLKCRSKEYIRSNIDQLKLYFESPQNTNSLRAALATSNNFTALKIVEQLGLKIVPHTHINTFAFTSAFWLNRMKIITDEEFEALIKRFQILRNFDVLFDNTEKIFISLQLEKRRRMARKYRRSVPDTASTRALMRNFRLCKSMTFMLSLDDIVEFERYVTEFSELRNYLFRTELRTFEEFQNDPHKNEKAYRFRDIKLKLSSCSIRNFSQFFKLDERVQDRLEELMRAVNKIKRCGFRYYIYSHKPLPSLMTFCYLYLNNIDLTKLIEIASGSDLYFNVPGRRVIFGRECGLGFVHMRRTMEGLRWVHKMSQ